MLIDDLTVEECAASAKVSPKTIRREIKDGRLKAAPIRGCIRIRREDWEEYRRQCRSENTAEAGKFEFNTAGLDLAKLLGPGRTRSRSSASCASGSRIVSLDERRATRSRKPSRAG